ncbi:MAG: phosphoribosyltransferase family protein [bacterium]
MDVPIFGVNVPAPPIRIKKELLEEYARLYKGIRNREDTVSWRTLIVTCRKILGVADPDYKPVRKSKLAQSKKLVALLVKKTYLEPLFFEIIYALGFRNIKNRKKADLDCLLFSGRHYPEPLLWNLADYLKEKGKSVAVVNPVGHYNDGQTRVVGPSVVFGKINKVIILTSTQTKFGGSVSVLSNVIRLLRNPKLAQKVKEVDVVIPMFGGSRGHRIGQSEDVGFEVMEAAFNAKLICLPTKDLQKKLSKEINNLPKYRYYSLDIHNSLYPDKIFKGEGFNFISIDPTRKIVEDIFKYLHRRRVQNIPIKVVACDTGAIVRTENFAKNLLILLKSKNKKLQIIYIEKKRPQAGTVSSAKISKIEEWKKEGRKITKRGVRIPKKSSLKESILIYSDDMIDTGGTAEKDLNYLSGVYPNCIMKIFVATHPVLSRGLSAFKRIGADVYFVGNSLNVEGLSEQANVQLVDLAPSICGAIEK